MYIPWRERAVFLGGVETWVPSRRNFGKKNKKQLIRNTRLTNLNVEKNCKGLGSIGKTTTGLPESPRWQGGSDFLGGPTAGKSDKATSTANLKPPFQPRPQDV